MVIARSIGIHGGTHAGHIIYNVDDKGTALLCLQYIAIRNRHIEQDLAAVTSSIYPVNITYSTDKFYLTLNHPSFTTHSPTLISWCGCIYREVSSPKFNFNCESIATSHSKQALASLMFCHHIDISITSFSYIHLINIEK